MADITARGSAVAAAAAHIKAGGVLPSRVLDAVRGHAIFALDASGVIVSWTVAASDIAGYSEDEVVGQPYGIFSAQSSEAETARMLQAAANTGCFQQERWWRRRDGGLIWVDEQIQPLEGTGYVVIVRDLTERTEAEERRLAAREREAEGQRQIQAGRGREEDALNRERLLRSELQAAERRAAFLAEASSILVATSLDFESTLRALARLAVSRVADWCAIHSLGEADTLLVAEVAHRDPRLEEPLQHSVREALNERWERAVRSVIGTGQSQILTRSSSEKWFSPPDDAARADVEMVGSGTAMITPLLGRGRVLGAITFVSTATDHEYDDEDLVLAEELGRRAAIALDNARLYRDAQEANRAKADFLAVMSHELRTPLNAIMGYSDLLDAEISGELSEKQRRQIDRIRASARHLLQLIEEILSFARIEAGGEEVRLGLADAKEIVDDAVAVIEPMAVSKGLEMHVRIDRNVTVETDTHKLRQVLVNLMSNAVKFTERGSVTVGVRADDEQLHLDIIDTGIGIPAEQLDRIFDPFWQVERPNTRRAGGTGLGLSVSRRYIRLLRGEISVQSEPGRGTCFTVSIPLRLTGAHH